jgi:tRNA (cytidine/uridine-2'-O-)-methyltransferase
MRLALYEPDIPQNTGTMLRLASVMRIGVDIIEPCGFLLDDRRMRRAGMDYLDHVSMKRHTSWTAFRANRAENGCGRLLLLTTAGDIPYCGFEYAPDDTLLMGRESAGVPDAVHDAADARLCIPMAPEARSLNVALAAAMTLGEALRQTGGFETLNAGMES